MLNHPFLAGLLLLALGQSLPCIFFAPGSAKSEEAAYRNVTLKLSGQHSFRYAGYYAAQKNGLYSDMGLKVEILPGTSSFNSINAVLQQDAHFGISGGGELVYHRLLGKPLTVIAPIMQHSPWAFLCLPLSRIKSPHDILDKSLLVSRRNISSEHLAVLKLENIPMNRVNMVSGNAGKFVPGQHEVFFADILDELFRINTNDQLISIISPRSYGVDFYGDTVFTSENETENHYDDVLAFKEASIKGWDYALDHPHELIDLIATAYNPSLSYDFYKFEADKLRKLIESDTGSTGHSNPGRWKHMEVTYKLLEKVPQDSTLGNFHLGSEENRSYLTSPLLPVTAVVLALPLLALLLYKKKAGQTRKLQTNPLVHIDNRLYRTVKHIHGFAIIGFDKERKIFFWNMGAQKLFGYSEKDTEGTYIDSLIIPDKHLREGLETLSAMGNFTIKDELNELIFQHKDGRQIKTFCSFIYLAEKKYNNEIYGVFFNTTSLEHLIHEKRASEERYHFLFETMPEGFALYEMIYNSGKEPIDYRFISVNPAFEKITGYRAQDVTGRTIREILPQFDQKWLKLYGDVAAAGKPARFLDHSIEKDRYFEIAAFSPKKGYLACFLNDISDIKHAEERIAYQASILDHVRNGIVVTTNGGIIKYLNRYAEHLYQYKAEEIIGRPFTTLIPHHNISEDSSAKNVLLKKEGFWQGETAHLRKDGSQFTAQISEQTILDDSGRVAAHLNIIEDISRQKDLLDLVQKYQNTITISTLAKSISNALNNHLAAIMGYAEIAQVYMPDDTSGKNTLNKISETAGQAKKLVNQIMLFDKSHIKEQISLNLSKIIEDALTLINTSLPPNIQLKVNLDNHCGTITGCPLQIYQLTLNLCSIVIAKLEKPGGILSVAISEDDGSDPLLIPENKYVSLTITAVSSGNDALTPADGEEVFYDLTYAQAVAKDHSGLFRHTTPAAGIHRFHLFFPEASRKITGRSEISSGIQRGKERILVVDDEKSIVEITGRILKGLGYEVSTAADSRKALAIFKTEPHSFDLIIADHTMPNITGSELTKIIHQIRPDIPIIMCTGYIHLIDEDLINNLGIQGLLSKPVTKKELAEKVRVALDAHYARG